jgi:TfoX/Sxy family transcriptional regulator of competence genes
MAYDEAVADRVREALGPRPELSERKMFGGLCLMAGGHMFCGILGDELMLRLGPDGAEAALDRPHVRPMDFTGRPMKGMVYVEPAGFRGEKALLGWLDLALGFCATLPPK